MSKTSNAKSGLVVGLAPDQYKVEDKRLNKPVCHQQYEKGSLTGSMLIQEINSVSLKGKQIDYFSPNNIGILLSINSSNTKDAESMFHQTIKELKPIPETNKASLFKSSSAICDYIEKVQIALVFGYTALETFANLSIPENYEYKKMNKSRGIHELYEKESIERWLSLKEKFQFILSDIYQTSKVEHQKWWGLFSNLENLRNDIIHQKSIKSTELYKSYFKESIFKICKCPTEVISFFYNAHEQHHKTNPVWPWLDGGKNSFPINNDFDSSRFEVIGNIHEGLIRK